MAELESVILEAVEIFAKCHYRKVVGLDGVALRPALELPSGKVIERSTPHEFLSQELFAVIYGPGPQAKLQDIWKKDGEPGIRRYLHEVCHNTFVDLVRRQKARQGEIWAVRTSDLIVEGEDSGAVDIAAKSDSDTVAAADLAILKEQLAASDFEILRRSIVEGLSIRDIADAMGMAKSTVGRRLNKARKVAHRHGIPTGMPKRLGTWGWNYEPDKIAPETVEAFRSSLQDRIAPFQDPELEYRERHYASIRRRKSLAA